MFLGPKNQERMTVGDFWLGEKESGQHICVYELHISYGTASMCLIDTVIGLSQFVCLFVCVY